MANQVEGKKKWLKDANIWIGIGGVVATILVGIVTYNLTEGSQSREYQERVRAARNEALVSVARSLGEGVVPDKAKIQALLNSVRRQYAIKEQDFETPDEVIDDTLARVLANEFLDARKREELSAKLLQAKGQPVPIAASTVPPSNQAPIAVSRITSLLISGLASLVAGVVILPVGSRTAHASVLLRYAQF